jgi:hypothetical protein
MSDLPDELPSDPAELRVFAAALLDAEHWLAGVLAKLINGWPASRLDELLPWASTYTMYAHDPRLAA